MNIEEFREFCLSLPHAAEKCPWTDPKYQCLITYTVADKWFCLLDIDDKYCNIKCPPDQVQELQEHFIGIEPAWHMNKTHWIKIVLDSDVPKEKIRSLVRQAYNLIINRLSKAKKEELGIL